MSNLNYTVWEIAEMTQGELLQEGLGENVHFVLIDSRKYYARPGQIFFALSGPNHNGHDYIEELYKKGVRSFVVSENWPWASFPEACFIRVGNTLKALQVLAKRHRQKFDLQLITLTGSNGKTIIKEWLYQLLYPYYHIVRSPKSYNSQIGVPLSALMIDASHQLGIFEVGISRKNEMAALEDILKPQIGIFTNIGPAHQENFSSYSEKIDEKLLLFKDCEKLIYCKDHSPIDQAVQIRKDFTPKSCTWSEYQEADLRIEKKEIINSSALLKGIYKGRSVEISLPFTVEVSIENAIHLWLLLLEMGLEDEKIVKRFSSLTPVAMRLEQIEGINGSVLINDAYNSDFNSLAIALDYLKVQTKNRTYTAIVSDILQSGEKAEVLYKRVADLIHSKHINRFIGIGEELCKHSHFFDKTNSEFYPSTEAFLKSLNKSVYSRDNILLKGARSFSFERISDLLQEKTHETVLEINLDRMVSNLNFIRSLLKPETKLMVMVKAFAYGSGSYDVAKILEYNRVDYLAVAYADEGISLREDGINLPIMVLNPQVSAFDAMIRYRLEPQLYSFRITRRFIDALEYAQKELAYPVHIKINTGMNRLGFDLNEIEELGHLLKNSENLEVKSVFSHLAGSDDPDFDGMTKKQISEFLEASETLERMIGFPCLKHILNSNGILRHGDAQFNMVRLGLGLYGLSSHPHFRYKLSPVSSLRTTISQIRKVKKGEGVGYNPKKRLSRDSVIAVLPLGYADGLPRLLGNGIGYVAIRGIRAPFVGNICMDMSMVDVTELSCQEGDHVEVFGDQMDIYEMADHLKTIPYEVLTNISQRVKRVFVQE